MKKTILTFVLLTTSMWTFSQTLLSGERKFQMLVKNESNVDVVQRSNNQLRMMTSRSLNGDERGLLFSLLKMGYGTLLSQKTVNASSNLINYGLSYIGEALKSDRHRWYATAQDHCHFTRTLSSETVIEDFYALPSTQGAMDPQNMQFNGFGCKNYIEVTEQPGQGHDVFYVFCRLRRDSVGIQHIVNHSKFLVEIDSLSFYPHYCDLPNDSTGSIESRFDFKKRKDLSLTLKVRLFSTWVNEAIMITEDKQLGEFTVHADIKEEELTPEGAFIYDKHNPVHQQLVTVDGDCFIVPRSFTGTTNAATYQPAWGTGQYRLEMDVMENCQINDEYYMIPEIGNAQAVVYAQSARGKRKWDKDKWKTEWTAMKARRKSRSFASGAWQSIVTAYRGDSWVATLTSPFITSLSVYETQKLNSWINLPPQ